MKAIITKPIASTANNPLRIQAQDYDGNKLLIPFNDSLTFESNHLVAAERFIKHLGLHGIVSGAPTEKGQVSWVIAGHEESAGDLYFEVKK